MGALARILWIGIVTAGLVVVGCTSEPAPPGGGGATPSTSEPLFIDAAAVSGLDFAHFNGMSGEFYYCEIVGAGGALFDYDGDGDLDVYLVQGTMLGPGKSVADATFAPKDPQLRDRLFRNDGTATGSLKFTDVTAESGIDSRGYGMGALAGDIDNDGDVDLYVTNLGANQMWRNNGDSTFSDITAEAGTGDERWSCSAAFLDYDRDGFLDLFVTTYLDFDVDNHKDCYANSGARDYCGPKSYHPLADRLYRNRGDGTFEDVTVESQIARQAGAGLGVVCADFDADGWIDIYVANDGYENHLWRNLGNGIFEDVAMLSGCALNIEAKREAGMGVDCGDVDGDGDEDIIVTHLNQETNTLYLNTGGSFQDRSVATGLGMPSWNYTGFGTGWMDYDGDGWLDLIAVNGAVSSIDSQVREGEPFPLRQRNQLFRNLGQLRFDEVTTSAGEAFEFSEVSRGVALGDVDNDGDVDVLITNAAGLPRLLLNQVGNRAAWIGLRLLGKEGRDALGARVAVEAGGRWIFRRSRTDGSFLSSNDPRALVGLGEGTTVGRVVVAWPDGTTEEWGGLEPRAWHTVTQGTGKPSRFPGGTAVAEPSPNDSDRSTLTVPPSRTLVEVPFPALDRLEPEAARKLAEARARVEQLASRPGPELAAAYGHLARRCHALTFLEAAHAGYHNATVLDPDHFDWLYLAGYIEQLLGNPDGARVYFERAYAIRPGHLQLLIRRGRIDFLSHRLDDGRRWFQEALAVDPGCGAAHYGLGLIELADRRFAPAVAHFEAALAALPHASEIHYPLAQALRELGEEKRAAEHLARRGNVEVTLSDPLLASVSSLREGYRPFLLKGTAYYKAGRFPEAERELRKAVEAAPDNAGVRINLGLVLQVQGDLHGAHAEFTETLRIDPSDERAHLNIGTVYSQLGRDEDAVPHYRAALAGALRSADAALNLAHALRRLGRFEESLDGFAEALRRDPVNGDAHLSRVLTLIRLHRYRDALTRIEEARKARPDDLELAHTLARLLATAPDDTVRNGERALALARRVGQVKASRTLERGATLAMALAECGHFDGAVRTQELLLQGARAEKNAEQIERFTRYLEDYRKGKACREPWPDAHPALSPPRLTPETSSVVRDEN